MYPFEAMDDLPLSTDGESVTDFRAIARAFPRGSGAAPAGGTDA